MLSQDLQNEEHEEEIIEEEIIEEPEVKEPPRKKSAQERIHEQTYQIKERDRKISSLENELLSLKLKEKDKEIDSLIREKHQAYEEGDTEKIVEIEKMLITQQYNAPQSQEFNPDTYFGTEYPWYNTNKKMKAVAITTDTELRADSYWSSRSAQERLDEVAKRTLIEFKSTTPKLSFTDGVSNSSPTVTNNGISADEIKLVRLLMPNLKTDKEVKEMVLEVRKGVN
jgi:hypothetical protein